MIKVLNSMGNMIFHSRPEFENISLGCISHEDMRSRIEDEIRGGHPAILLLEGGADINPKLYGEENLYSGFSAHRDAHEVFCYNLARSMNIPILGICRGHQLMAALGGGSLWQDIGRQLGRSHGGSHTIQFEESDHLPEFRALMETNPTGRSEVVNSLHHQAVREVPEGAVVLARHKDQTPEAIWYSYGLSVQWHPEFLGHTDFIFHMAKRFYGDTHGNNGTRARAARSGEAGSDGDKLLPILSS